MSSENTTPPPAIVGRGPFEFEILEEDAPIDQRRWRLKIENGALVVQTWKDDMVWHDTLVVERTGAVARVKLPPMPDLKVLVEKFPALVHAVPLVRVARRITEIGAGDDPMPPSLIHTKVAAQVWPIFGLPYECPPAGGANLFGTMAVWAPALDQFVSDPDAK